MNTREIAKEYRLSHWAKIVQDCSESGLTIKAYCEGAGIYVNSYYYWLKKLREVAGGALTNIQCNNTSVATPVFAEIKLPERLEPHPLSHVPQSHICIEAAGIRMTAGGEYPADKLAELLRVVSRPCC